MESTAVQGSRLHLHLKESGSRFQTLMQRLLAKYNQPFEDAPLVQMATLTYETPQGLRVWGGQLIKNGDKDQPQGPSVKVIDRLNGQAAEGALESSGADASLEEDDWPSLESSGADASLEEDDWPSLESSGADASLEEDDWPSCNLTMSDASGDPGQHQNAEKGGGKDTAMTWVPSVTSPVTPAPGCQDGTSAQSFGGPEVSASSSRGQDPSYTCPGGMTIVTRNDNFFLLGTSSNGISNQSFEADDTSNVTISDLYEGMMHSMSRLLRSKPSCIISTKTYINQTWKPRRRLSRKQGVHKNTTYISQSWKPRRRLSSKQGAHKNMTYCHRKEPVPCSEPGKEARILRDYKNLLNVAPCKTGLELKSISLEGDKLQVHKFSPAWKVVQTTPHKDLDLNLERENRLKALQCLISPVKMVPRPRMLPSQVEKWHREIKIKFDRLHQEYCLSAGKRPPLTGPMESWAADMYRSGSKSPGSRQGVDTHRLNSPLSREKTERLGEAFEELRGKTVKTNSRLLRSGPSPEDSLSKSSGQSQQSDLLQEHNSEPTGKAVWPSTASSAPCTGSPVCGKNNYDELKKEFNRLYQKYCLVSPQRVKVTSCSRVSPVKAAAAVPGQTEHLKRPNPDSPLQRSQKCSSSPGRIPQASAALEVHTSAQTASALVRAPWLSTKRRRLSYPEVCAHQAKSQDSLGAAGWP